MNKSTNQNNVLGTLCIILGLAILSMVNHQSSNQLQHRVTDKIDRTFCTSFAQNSLNVNDSIHECMLDARHERQQKMFL